MLVVKDFEFKISKELDNKCTDFAKRLMDKESKSKFNSRHQSNPEKIIKDHKISKFAEEGVLEYLGKKYHIVKGPDYEIYDVKQKSWDTDIIVEDYQRCLKYEVHVKSQDVHSAMAFGCSWIFQDTDAGIFSNKDLNHYVAFVSLNTPNMFGVIEAIVNVRWLHEHKLFKSTKIQRLRDNKSAIYYEDLANHPEDLWQL